MAIFVDNRDYFDFSLFATRIDDVKDFITRRKYYTIYQSITEKELPEGSEVHILKDKFLYLTGQATRYVGIDKVVFRRVALYKEEENKVIVVIINNLD